MSNIRLRNVTKRFGSTVTLHQVNLDIEDGEFAVFVGPSGCGKSTLLRMIAGLEEVSEGEVLIGDEVMNDVVPARRGVAMVFQSYALYPHMTVAENMGYGLKVNKVPKEEIAKWHLNRSQFGIRIDHDLASISDHSLASQSITIWHASDH